MLLLVPILCIVLAIIGETGLFGRAAERFRSDEGSAIARVTLKRVADSERLEQDPDFNGENRGLLSRLLGPARPPGDAVDLIALANTITIKRPERTYVVEVQASASKPEKAASLANAVAHAYNEDQIAARVQAAENDSRWVRQKLADLETQVRAAENKVESYKSANRIVTTEGLRSNEQQVADLTKELGTARARASEAKARLDQVQRIAKQGRIEASADALKSPVIERLRTQQADSEREVARLSETLGSRHPALVEAWAQNTRVKALIRDELVRIQTGIEAEYNAARANATRLEHQIDQLKGQSNVTTEKQPPPSARSPTTRRRGLHGVSGGRATATMRAGGLSVNVRDFQREVSPRRLRRECSRRTIRVVSPIHAQVPAIR